MLEASIPYIDFPPFSLAQSNTHASIYFFKNFPSKE